MIEINKEKTVSVTGHRLLGQDFDRIKLEEVLLERIRVGYEIFLTGMAVGFDTECFKILVKLRKKYPIKIIACIPCERQSEKFSLYQKIEYNRLLSLADDKILVSKEYTPYCMQKRNMFMVDNSSLLIAYIRDSKGGTKNTITYAKKQNKSIIYV